MITYNICDYNFIFLGTITINQDKNAAFYSLQAAKKKFPKAIAPMVWPAQS